MRVHSVVLVIRHLVGDGNKGRFGSREPTLGTIGWTSSLLNSGLPPRRRSGHLLVWDCARLWTLGGTIMPLKKKDGEKPHFSPGAKSSPPPHLRIHTSTLSSHKRRPKRIIHIPNNHNVIPINS